MKLIKLFIILYLVDGKRLRPLNVTTARTAPGARWFPPILGGLPPVNRVQGSKGKTGSMGQMWQEA